MCMQCKLKICYFSLIVVFTLIISKSGTQVVSLTCSAWILVRHSPLSTCSRMMSSLGFKPNKGLIWEIRTGFGLSASKGSRTIQAVSKHRAQTGVPQLFHQLTSPSQSAKQFRIPQRASTEAVVSLLNWPDLSEN